MKTLIIATAALALGLGSAAHAQMASDKPKTEAMGAMASSDHMKADKPMAKKPMAKKPMKKAAKKTDAMSSSMSTDAMAKH